MGFFELFFTFFYIGLITIGGGLVGIPIMQQLLVKDGLLTGEQFYSMVAISESTPGPIGINMATYIGYELYGIWGGVITTLASVLPSLIVIIIIAKWFGKISEQPLTKKIFYGLRPGVTGMIAVATWNVFAISLFNPAVLSSFPSKVSVQGFFNIPAILFFVPALFCLLKLKVHPTFLIVGGAVFGIIFL